HHRYSAPHEHPTSLHHPTSLAPRPQRHHHPKAGGRGGPHRSLRQPALGGYWLSTRIAPAPVRTRTRRDDVSSWSTSTVTFPAADAASTAYGPSGRTTSTLPAAVSTSTSSGGAANCRRTEPAPADTRTRPLLRSRAS